MSGRRDRYLCRMAQLYGYTPDVVDGLRIRDFEILAGGVDAYEKTLQEAARG